MESLVFPLHTLPSLHYVQLFLQQEVLNISVAEPFQKQTMRSRFEIMGPNQRQALSIPLQKGKSKCRMDEVKISYAEPWQRKHWQSLETAYQNSPFFEYYDYKLKPVFMAQPAFLWVYNLGLLQLVLQLLKVEKPILLTEEMPTYNENKKIELPEYEQVFSDKLSFMPNLSILDWLFNEGAF